MALQIRPIKASQRQILPELNRSVYTPTATVNGRQYYRRKAKPIKSERKRILVTENGKTRFVLENKALAKRTARARQGSAIPKDKFATWNNSLHKRKETPQALKNGILGMAKSSGVTDTELFRKLNELDPDKLQEMYDQDSLIFEVAYSYNETGDPLSDKEGDLQYLVSVYEERYGAL